MVQEKFIVVQYTDKGLITPFVDENGKPKLFDTEKEAFVRMGRYIIDTIYVRLSEYEKSNEDEVPDFQDLWENCWVEYVDVEKKGRDWVFWTEKGEITIKTPLS